MKTYQVFQSDHHTESQCKAEVTLCICAAGRCSCMAGEMEHEINFYLRPWGERYLIGMETELRENMVEK